MSVRISKGDSSCFRLVVYKLSRVEVTLPPSPSPTTTITPETPTPSPSSLLTLQRTFSTPPPPPLPFKGLCLVAFCQLPRLIKYSQVVQLSHHSATLFWSLKRFTICLWSSACQYVLFCFLLWSLTDRRTPEDAMNPSLHPQSGQFLFYTTTKPILTSKAWFSAKESVVSLSISLSLSFCLLRCCSL